MVAKDTFKGSIGDRTGPPSHAFTITPSDDEELTFMTRGIYLGVAGDVAVQLQSGDIVTFVGMAAGMIHPLRLRQVYATGTTATGIVGIY